MPVVDYYRERGKVVEASVPGRLVLMGQIDSSPPVEVVYDNVRTAMDQRLALVPTSSGAGQVAAPEPSKHNVAHQMETLSEPASQGNAPQLGAPVI